MKKHKRILSGATSAAMLMGAAAQAEVAVLSTEVNAEAAEAQFATVADVQGTFAYNQDVLSPTDDIFSIFGTVVTAMCAKPAYELENSKVDFYINIGGKVEHSSTVNLADLKDIEQSETMLCACATGPATASVAVTGVSLEDVLSIAKLQADANTVTVTGSDGYKAVLPLRYALERKAMVVYQVNGEKVPSGTQLWVPGTVAKYFVRDVVDVEVTAEQEEAEVEQRADDLRAEVTFVNKASAAFSVGDEITFEGYADDFGSPIVAVEFSLDNGETWTSYETENMSAEKWVYWNYMIEAKEAGSYRLSARARTQDGMVSPLAASVEFTVE